MRPYSADTQSFFHFHGPVKFDVIQEVPCFMAKHHSVQRVSGRRKSADFTDREIKDYLINKALKIAKKLESKSKSKSSCETFVWRKKIQRDVLQGVLPPNGYSLDAEKARLRERMAEMEKAKKQRERSEAERARRQEKISMLARRRALAEFQDREARKEEFLLGKNKVVMASEAAVSAEHIPELKARKPKYLNFARTGYCWNQYNRTHYNGDNPPPKSVQGYKFEIFYPDLVDKRKAPVYTIEKDGDSAETCVIRFRAGAPYEDISFGIINNEWDYSRKKGFNCTFDRGILHLCFNFKRHPYRR
uniref:Splicing factor Cactin C-terminal domain-containing protein n=1 Tax=Kalanchoe fedtschenkoi TaxID=63787 RepID=A0A7N0UHB2_KALFE